MGANEEEHDKGGDNNADDDKDQSGAGIACSHIGRSNRRFHGRLDADSHWTVVFQGVVAWRQRAINPSTTFLGTLQSAILEGFSRKCGAMWWFFDGEIMVEGW